MELQAILKVVHSAQASDLHLKVGLPPICRVNGRLVPFKDAEKLDRETVLGFIQHMATPEAFAHFEQTKDLDAAYDSGSYGRFRVNCFMQRGLPGVVMRRIAQDIPTIDQLMLPKAVSELALAERGLILVTGITGSGKSSTLASMINFINITKNAHILTLEDPIEYTYYDRRSIINQREIGADTYSFGAALRAALREDPDVILVGEMRDKETIEMAFKAASTGHLVLSTLHTLNAVETISRIVSTFEPYQQKTIRLQLASILRGVISQRLVPTADGKGRVPAVELLKVTARAQEMIEDPEKTSALMDVMREGFVQYGMQTFDQSLMQHLKSGRITKKEALRQASNPDDFELRLQGVASTSDSAWDHFEGDDSEEGDLDDIIP